MRRPFGPLSRLLALVLLTMLASIGAAQAAERHGRLPAPPAKPTVVLVHGAWADSGAWDGVVARLQARGFPVRAVPTPLGSLSGDAAHLAGLLATIHGPVVLVGHSYGGAVVTDAATSAPNVARLVYVDAFAPDEGETVLQLATQRPGSARSRSRRDRRPGGASPAGTSSARRPGDPAGGAALHGPAGAMSGSPHRVVVVGLGREGAVPASGEGGIRTLGRG